MDRRCIKTEENNGVLTVRFKDFTDTAFEEIDSLVNQGHTNLLLDFERTPLLPSAFIGKLFALRKTMNKVLGKIVLCVPRPSLQDQLLRLKVDHFFSLQKNLPVLS